jgi:hypothetical protein
VQEVGGSNPLAQTIVSPDGCAGCVDDAERLRRASGGPNRLQVL